MFLKIIFFLDVTLRNLAEINRRFKGANCGSIMKATRFHHPDNRGTKHLWNVGQLQKTKDLRRQPRARRLQNLIYREISSSHGGEYEVQICLLGCRLLPCKIIVDRRFRGTCCIHHQGSLSLWNVDNYFTRQYITEDKPEPEISSSPFTHNMTVNVLSYDNQVL
jgi:hypothetical protein